MAKTISKYSMKKYRCTDCGHESMIGTNHYGQCYPKCKECGWKHPMSIHECLEPVPEGMTTPEPWKMVRVGDIASVNAV